MTNKIGKEKSVGLVVMTKLPKYGEAAVLQVRGEFNHEKMSPESYPGGCQVTVHGKAKEGENILDALEREIREELGEAILPLLKKKTLEELTVEKTKKELKVTYGVFLEADFIRLVKLNASSGGLRMVKQEELNGIVNLQTFERDEGVRDRMVVAMFPDEIEAVRLAFEKLITAK